MEQMYPKCMAMISNRFTVVSRFSDCMREREGGEGGGGRDGKVNDSQCQCWDSSCGSYAAPKSPKREYIHNESLVKQMKIYVFLTSTRKTMTIFFLCEWFECAQIESQINREKEKIIEKNIADAYVYAYQYTKATRTLNFNKITIRTIRKE